MKFAGKEAHAGFDPEHGINAISMAADAVSKIKTGRLSDQATLSISSIKGGSDQCNVVAATCTVEGEFRSLDKTAGGRKKEELEQILAASASKFGGRASLEWVESYPRYEFDEIDPALEFLHEAADAAGVQLKAISTGGGSDANILNSKGCMAIALASGMTRCHSPSEYILIEDLVNTAKFIEQIVITAGREAPLHHGISTETQGDLRHDHLRLI